MSRVNSIGSMMWTSCCEPPTLECWLIAGAHVPGVEIAVFLADDVGQKVAVSGSFCWWAILMARLPKKLLVLEPGCVLAQFLGEIEDVLREADDRDAAAPAGLLKEVVPARDEILKLVLPEEYRIGRFRELAPEPCPLENELQDDVDEAAGFVAVFQHRKIADDDLAFMRGHLRREGAFAAAEQPVERIEQELVGHPDQVISSEERGRSSKAGHLLKMYCVAKSRSLHWSCVSVSLRALIGLMSWRAIGLLLPRLLFVFIGPGGKRLNDAVDVGNGDPLARKIEQLDDIAHQLLVAALPERIVAVAPFLLADGDEGREEVDDALQIARAAAGPCPFVMQRVEVVAGLGVKDDEVLLASAGLRVANPVWVSSALAVSTRPPILCTRRRPKASCLPLQLLLPAPGAPVINVPSQSALRSNWSDSESDRIGVSRMLPVCGIMSLSEWNARLDEPEKEALDRVLGGDNGGGDGPVSPAQAIDYSLEHSFERASAVSEKRLKSRSAALRRGLGAARRGRGPYEE